MIFKKPVLSDGITESTFECKRDGLTIRGTIYRPKGDHLPIAIVCHGFMAWQDSVKHYAAFEPSLMFSLADITLTPFFLLSIFYGLVQNRIPSFLYVLSLLGLYENFKKCFLKSLIS